MGGVDNVAIVSFMFFGTIPLGLLLIWLGYRLKASVGKKRWVSISVLCISGVAVMTLNPFLNMIVFRPFAPHGFIEKMGDNEKYIGKSIDLLILEKGQPNRINAIDGLQRWYYNVNKPFFVFEFDELEFTVKDKNVEKVRIDYF
jgi:hypothetical protein